MYRTTDVESPWVIEVEVEDICELMNMNEVEIQKIENLNIPWP